MRRYLLLGMVVALVGAAFAYPTLTGPTGLITLPTASSLPAGQISLAADYYNTSDGPVENSYPVRATLGLASSIEVGAAYLFQDNADMWVLNAKLSPIINLIGFDWGAGAQYAKQNLTPADETVFQLYWVGTMMMSDVDEGQPAIGLTVGANWTDSDLLDDNTLRFFAGVEAGFANNFSLIAEYQTEDEDFETDPVWSVGARFGFTDAISAQVAWTNGPFFGRGEHNLTAGINFGWGAVAQD